MLPEAPYRQHPSMTDSMDKKSTVDRDDGVRRGSGVGVSLTEPVSGVLRLGLDDPELASDSPRCEGRRGRLSGHHPICPRFFLSPLGCERGIPTGGSGASRDGTHGEAVWLHRIARSVALSISCRHSAIGQGLTPTFV